MGVVTSFGPLNGRGIPVDGYAVDAAFALAVAAAGGDVSATKVLARGATIPRLMSDIAADVAELAPVRALGGLFDGQHHPLSEVTSYLGQATAGWTLAQWQAVLPAQALTDELDGLVVQKFWNDRLAGGCLEIPGMGYSSYEIATNAAQSIVYQGVGRDLSGFIFLNVGGYGLTHGRTTEATGTCKIADLAIYCQGGAFASAHVCLFSGGQRPWGHTLERLYIEGVNGNNDWWANAATVKNIVRGLSWKDVVTFGHAFFVLPTNAFEFPADMPCDSYNFDNCMAVGYNYGWNFQFTGDASITDHRHEEGQFYNCQAYSGVGLFQLLDSNSNAPLSDNWTFAACGWQGTGPAFNVARVQELFVNTSLLVNDPTTVADATTIASIINCWDVEFSNNEYFSVDGASNHFNFFYISGASSRNIRLDRNYITNYNTFDEFLYIDASVPAGAVFEQRTAFATTIQPNNGFIIDASNAQASELRVIKAVAASIAAGTSGPNAIATMDNQGVITLTDSFSAPTNDAFGNFLYNYPPGLFRATPAAVQVSNGNAAQSTEYPISSPGSSAGIIVRWPGVTTTGTTVTTNITVVGKL